MTKALLSPAKYMFDAQLNYLVDAGYQRIYLEADCRHPGVIAHRNDDIINFAIQAAAVKHFISDEKGISFESRIEGRVMHLFFPWDSIVGIFPPDENFLGIPNIQDPWGIKFIATGKTNDVRLEIFKENQDANPLKEIADIVFPKKEEKKKPNLRIVD